MTRRIFSGPLHDEGHTVASFKYISFTSSPLTVGAVAVPGHLFGRKLRTVVGGKDNNGFLFNVQLLHQRVDATYHIIHFCGEVAVASRLAVPLNASRGNPGQVRSRQGKIDEQKSTSSIRIA